jgi:RNA polymerase sigma-70 factor (ECF subfamily)
MGASTPSESAASADALRARFEATIDPHLDALLRTGWRMLGTREAGEDAVQETVLRAWRYFGSYDPARSAKVWLFAILRNVVYDALRKRGREPRAEEGLDGVADDRLVVRGGAASRAPAPSARLEAEEVLDAIRRLPEDYRIVALLAIVEEASYQEIADAVGIPIGTVMSRLFRARKLLQARLQGYVGGGAASGAAGVA